GLDLLLAAIVLDRVDVAEAERADEQRALVAPGHLPRGQHARGPDLDLEARRQLDLLDQGCELGVGGAGRRTVRRRQTFLRLGFVAKEPVIRRMGPEFLVAGFVLLEGPILVGLRLRTGHARARDNADCRKRKNRSMENRFHPVSPYAARRLRKLLILDGSRGRTAGLRGSDAKMLAHPGRERSAVSAKRSNRNNIDREFSRADFRLGPICVGRVAAQYPDGANGCRE